MIRSNNLILEARNTPEMEASYTRYVSRSQSLPIPFHSPDHSRELKLQHSFPFPEKMNDHNQSKKGIVPIGSPCNHQDDRCWNLSKVKIFPSCFHLEKNHAYIQDMSIDAIAENISDVLRSESLEVTYDDNEAIAYCETSKDKNRLDYCKFQIRIFKADSTSSTVLVEVQRRCGCCIAYKSAARNILCAAKSCRMLKEEIPNLCIPEHLISLSLPLMNLAW